MQTIDVIPHLFRTEFQKLVAVLVKRFGITHIEVAEDMVSETFLLAAETWAIGGLPENPTAWLYTVAKNKAKDQLKRAKLFQDKVNPALQNQAEEDDGEIDLSETNIADSQLQMLFAVCHPAIPAEAQIGLALRILCGFGIEEIAAAFLSNKETINKRLHRAKERLRAENIPIAFPPAHLLPARLDTVAKTLYLLFNEGYLATTQDAGLRKELCIEAMRLTLMLLAHPGTRLPQISALLSLMCFHASRFDARLDPDGTILLYDEQDRTRWDQDLIQRGEYYLNQAAVGEKASAYHLEAAIAYWHTRPDDSPEKWHNILQLYNHLLQVAYSPMAALNRTYALARAGHGEAAIRAAEQLDLGTHHLYHALLGQLYAQHSPASGIPHFERALALARSAQDRRILQGKIEALKAGCKPLP
jgi:RNA polymerase sigma-70 factor (ECF subfamily)